MQPTSLAPEVPPYDPWPAEGLPLRPALFKTADPDLKSAWEQAQKALESAGGRRRWRTISRGIYDDDTDRSRNDARRDRLERDERASGREVLANFVSRLAASRLIATGSRGSPTAPRTPIPATSWNDLGIKHWDRSIVVERTKEKICWYAVTVAPLLHSSQRVRTLAGLTLKEAFQRFVLDDPELIARSKPVLRLAPEYARVFKDGRYTVAGWKQWPLARDAGYACLTTRGTRFIGRLNDDVDLPDLIAACDVLQDRIDALFDVFRRGELIVRGVPAHAGHADVVLRSVWFHQDYWFEFAGGDILQINHESRERWDTFKRVWLGGVLELPSATHQTGPIPEKATTASRKQNRSASRQANRKADEILAAATGAGIDVFDGSISARKTADQLAPHMLVPPKSESQLHALEKAISRMRVAARTSD